MRLFFIASLFLLVGVTFGQRQKKSETSFQIINRIYHDYIKYSEATDSKEDKDSMTEALKNLQFSSSKTELYLLINIWMYYDPTDYPTRDLINPIFFKNKLETIYNIDKRIKNKKDWESNETAPFSELFALKELLSKQ
jgi:hypothetical protein